MVGDHAGARWAGDRDERARASEQLTIGQVLLAELQAVGAALDCQLRDALPWHRLAERGGDQHAQAPLGGLAPEGEQQRPLGVVHAVAHRLESPGIRGEGLGDLLDGAERLAGALGRGAGDREEILAGLLPRERQPPQTPLRGVAYTEVFQRCLLSLDGQPAAATQARSYLDVVRAAGHALESETFFVQDWSEEIDGNVRSLVLPAHERGAPLAAVRLASRRLASSTLRATISLLRFVLRKPRVLVPARPPRRAARPLSARALRTIVSLLRLALRRPRPLLPRPQPRGTRRRRRERPHPPTPPTLPGAYDEIRTLPTPNQGHSAVVDSRGVYLPGSVPILGQRAPCVTGPRAILTSLRPRLRSPPVSPSPLPPLPPLGRRALCAALGLPQSAAAAYSPPPHRELPQPPALRSPRASPSPAVPVPAGLRGEHARCLLTHSHRLRSRQKGLHVDLANGGATAAAAVAALKVDTRAKRVGLNLVIDSGCTFHMHGHKADLINQRRCSDTVGGIDGIVHHCTTIGDLPVFARATSGKIYRLLLQDVRHFEGVPYSLVSVKQLWTSGGVDSVFRDVECMIVPTSAGTISFPFTHRGGVYQWRVDGCASEAKARRDQGLVLKANAKPPPPPPPLPARLRVATADPQATTGAIHRAKASAHLDALGSNTVAAILHRRLHAGLDRLRKLATTTADAPLGIAAASGLNRGPHVEANAVRASHTGKGYTPSYPGPLPACTPPSLAL